MLFSNEAFHQQHIIVTGATGGIGYKTAKALLQAGATVTVTGRNEEKLTQLQKESGENGTIIIIPSDLNDAEDRSRLIKQAVEQGGPVTGLVNSAGITGGGTLEDLTEEDLRNVMELNFFSTVLFTQQVYAHMKVNRKGAIVNVASLSGLRGTHGNTAYSGSKFALVGFTQSFAVEAIEHGIRVNAVCPGFVETEMGRNAIKKKAEREGVSFDEQMESVKKGLPSGRITQPEEVANSILFLLSDAAENIVGESMKISGGSVMR